MKRIVLAVLVIFQMYLKATDGESAAALMAAKNWCKANWTNYPTKYTSIKQCTEKWIDSGHADFLLPDWYFAR
jgi:hypothetical protein